MYSFKKCVCKENEKSNKFLDPYNITSYEKKNY